MTQTIKSKVIVIESCANCGYQLVDGCWKCGNSFLKNEEIFCDEIRDRHYHKKCYDI